MRIDWNRVNWGEQDIELARQLGCSREAVRQARPEGRVAFRHRKRTIPTALARLEAMDTAGMTLEKAAGLAGCNARHAGKVLRGLGKAYVRKPKWNARHDWLKFPANWRELTDKQIAGIVGVDDPSVVTQWRNRHGYRKTGLVHDKVEQGKVVTV